MNDFRIIKRMFYLLIMSLVLVFIPDTSAIANEYLTENLEDPNFYTEVSNLPIQSVRSIDPEKPMIALTFDDGPYAPVGNQIMDCLAQYNGKATFFIVGNRVASYRQELQRMVSEGHEIGNHTYEHKYLTKLNSDQIKYQINKCNDAVFDACGVRPELVRLPGGLKNNTVIENINVPIIMWSIDTMDWKTKNAVKTEESVIGKVKDGDIILMHEIYKQSGLAATSIIPKLTEQGYQLVTVSELAQYRGNMKNGGIYSNFHKK